MKGEQEKITDADWMNRQERERERNDITGLLNLIRILGKGDGLMKELEMNKTKCLEQ